MALPNQKSIITFKLIATNCESCETPDSQEMKAWPRLQTQHVNGGKIMR